MDRDSVFMTRNHQFFFLQAISFPDNRLILFLSTALGKFFELTVNPALISPEPASVRYNNRNGNCVIFLPD